MKRRKEKQKHQNIKTELKMKKDFKMLKLKKKIKELWKEIKDFFVFSFI
jgi:hypothetical protein